MTRTTQTWMRRALELAERGRGCRAEPAGRRRRGPRRPARRRGLAPEVRRGRTPRSTRWPRPARRRAAATLYVTLEPCCHHGKTPPCTDAVAARRRGARGRGDGRPVPAGRRRRRCAAARRGHRGRGRPVRGRGAAAERAVPEAARAPAGRTSTPSGR